MSRRVHALGTIVVLTMLGCRSVGGAVPEARTLTVALPVTATAEDRRSVASFESIVEVLSAGALAVEVAPLGEACGDATACLAALRAGEITLAPVTTVDLVGLFPQLEVLDLPYLFENAAVVERVFDGPFSARLRDALVHHAGLRPMAFGAAGGWRTLANAKRAVKTPADLRGLRLWTAGSSVEANLVAALGGEPRSLPRAEFAAALATGAIDGGTTSIADLVALDLQERIRHVTLDRHSYVSVIWLINDMAYQALPENQRLIVQAGFDELERLGLGVPAAREAEAVRAFEAAGGAVYTPTADERRQFLMAAGRVATEYVEERGYDWLVWLEGAIAEAERQIELVKEGPD